MKTLLILTILIVSATYGQSEYLERYIKYGLENNQVLKQKQFSLEKSIAELKEARGMFYPSLGINARYTRAGGGRTIEIPIGDLVNPIHEGLNSLLPNNPYPGNIPNGVTNFLRPEEHETKVSLIQPIIQPALFYNYSLKSNLLTMQSFEKKTFKRNLISDIKTAYYNYLKAKQVESIYRNTKLLITENLRITRSLYKNDKVTVDLVYRAEAELSEIEQKQLEAENDSDIAASYFNFLINRPLDTSVHIDSLSVFNIEEYNLDELESTALSKREELQQLKVAVEASEDSKGIAKSNYLPGLSLAVDYGFQGEKYKFSKDDDYWMASLVLNWNLFNGFKDEAKTEIAEIEKQNILAKTNEIRDLIILQTKEAHKNYLVASKTISASNERLNSYNKSFNIVKKKYAEGMASQLEYLDAQNKLVQSEVSKIIAEYNLLESIAVLEKVTASIDLEKYNIGKEK